MGKKALIADDADIIRSKLDEFFKAAGFDTILAEDGKVAMEMIEKESHLDIIVTDLNMPHIDGMELSRKTREIERFRSVPIFVLSTESTPDLKKKGKECGVTAWILKPFNPDSMKNVMKMLKIG